MNVDRAAPDDAAEIRALLAACGLPYADLIPSHLEHFFVARDGTQLVGVVGLELLGDAALLRSLAVCPGCHGQGLGSRLVAKAEVYAQSQGVATLYLLTTTADSYFARRHYQPAERYAVPASIAGTTEFASVCPSAAVCMLKHLAKPSSEEPDASLAGRPPSTAAASARKACPCPER
jgi:amino-acid N-acetyltransferase